MELVPGAFGVMQRTFTQAEFDRFAALSGDDNPIHVDPAFAARTRFGRTVCHGMLLFSTLCAAFTRELQPGCTLSEQELMFVTPTYTDEAVTVQLAVAALAPDGAFVDLNTAITRPDGSLACQGQARLRRARGEAPGQRAADGLRLAAHPTPEATDAQSHKGLRVGQWVEIERTFTTADLAAYVALTGDVNPAYVSAAAAELQTPPGLLGGLFSFLLGTRLPGRGTNWLKQRLVFPMAAAVGAPIRARVEIVRLRPDKDLVNLRTTCSLADGRVVCHGEALVLVKDLEAA